MSSGRSTPATRSSSGSTASATTRSHTPADPPRSTRRASAARSSGSDGSGPSARPRPVDGGDGRARTDRRARDGNLMPADPRRRPGLRDRRRDLRPPAGRLGRAPRAHHGLSRPAPPSGMRQCGRQRPSSSWRQSSEAARPGAVNGRWRSRPAPRSRSSGAVSAASTTVRCGMTSSKIAAVRRVVRPARRRRPSVRAVNGPAGSGLEPDDPVVEAPDALEADLERLDRRPRSRRASARTSAVRAATSAGTGRGP